MKLRIFKKQVFQKVLLSNSRNLKINLHNPKDTNKKEQSTQLHLFISFWNNNLNAYHNTYINYLLK